jgi:predicted Zn-dependent protease
MRILLQISLMLALVSGPMLTTPSFALSLDDLKKELKEAKKKLKKSADKGKEQLDKASGKLSEEEEIEIGGNLVSGLLGAAPLVDDARLQRYVNDVGFWVASQSRRKHLPWRFAVIDS